MQPARRAPRGFTLIEMAVTVAIIGIVAAIAYSSISRQRPRATLASATAELQSLIHGARQAALASGNDVAVLFYPAYFNGQGTGRVIVYQDGNFTFFTTGAVNFGSYNPGVLATDTRSQILATMDLPAGVTVGPPTGMGASVSLPAPLQNVLVNVACSFCAAGGSSPPGPGAVRFDPRGQAWFYQGGGTAPFIPLTVNGGASVSLTSGDVAGPRTLVITGYTGAVRLVSSG